MSKFDLNRFNLEKIRLGEQPLSLKRTSYKKPKVKDGMLVDKDGKPIGTKGDMYAKVIMDKILQEGCLDHDPRPHYEDIYEDAAYDEKRNVVVTKEGKEIQVGENETVKVNDHGVVIWVPAHTISVNQGIECSYDLSKGESPMITLRPIATKASIAEILWIYQKESNDLVLFDELLGRCTWDEDHKINNWWNDWALRYVSDADLVENGGEYYKDDQSDYLLNAEGHPTIGACYGGTTGPRNMLRSQVIDAIRNNPDGRRNITCLWQQDDFERRHGLKPCAFLTIWNVRHDWDGKDYLDMTMVQRSSDFATAGCINQVQYASLLIMVAKELGMTPGVFTWRPVNVQLYDRHIAQAIEMLNREPVSDVDATIKVKDGVSFDDFTTADIKIFDQEAIQKVKTKNPQFKFPLGI